MSIRKIIKNILTNEDLTIKELAQRLSEKNKKVVTPDSISQKLLRGTIKHSEVEDILDVLGYDIIFQKKS